MVCRVSDSAKVAGENLPAGQAGTNDGVEIYMLIKKAVYRKR